MSTPKSPARTFQLASLGSKLASATVALMIAVTCGIYLGLSDYQRDNLLRAKELSGLALTRLFGDSCVAGIVFEDDAAVEDAIKTLGRNAEVEYAGVWAVEPSGKLGRRIAELARGKKESATQVPRTMTAERQATRLVISAPVRDQNAAVVAVATVALSLENENRAIAQVERRTLWVSSAVALGLTVLLVGMVRLLIVRPLGKLVLAARRLEAGERVDLDRASEDEVGKLTTAFRSMADAIEVREQRINARNRDMRLVLDNVGQGFITLDPDGVISAERSRVVDEWFGHADGPVEFWKYVGRVDAKTAEWFELGWEAVRDDVLPLELALDQLPSTLTHDGRTFELSYRPILRDGRAEKILVVITDVTARIAREREERAHREMTAIFRRILADRFAFEAFFREGSALVEAIVAFDGDGLSVLTRQIHTLKGNCASFEIESVESFCHELETELSVSAAPLSSKQREALRGLWAAVAEARAQLSRGDDAGVEIDGDEYDEFLADVRRGVGHERLLLRASSFRFERAQHRLAFFAEQARRAGRRLGKTHIEVSCTPTRLRLPPKAWSPLWTVFPHLLRNAVDHGLESAEERTARGKPEVARMILAITRDVEHVHVTIADDGRGIQWAKIAERAAARGLPHATQQDLEAALFSDGISSREEVTRTSGRGVGLSAVREIVQALGGTISVHSEPGKGTTFELELPLSMLSDVEVAPARPVSPSAVLRAAAQ